MTSSDPYTSAIGESSNAVIQRSVATVFRHFSHSADSPAPSRCRLAITCSDHPSKSIQLVDENVILLPEAYARPI